MNQKTLTKIIKPSLPSENAIKDELDLLLSLEQRESVNHSIKTGKEEKELEEYILSRGGMKLEQCRKDAFYDFDRKGLSIYHLEECTIIIYSSYGRENFYSPRDYKLEITLAGNNPLENMVQEFKDRFGLEEKK